MEAILSRTGTRFLVVSLLPNGLLAGFVLFLFAAGAPTSEPGVHRAVDALNNLTALDLFIGATLILASAVALHPIQYPLIQLLEGYWTELPFGAAAADAASGRYRDRWHELSRLRDVADRSDPRSHATGISAANALEWLPKPPLMLPTSLGNALRAGEDRAAQRYGMDVQVLLPRLFPVMSPEVREQLNDRRNQLDAAARLSVVAIIGTLASIAILLPTGTWLYVPFVTFVLGWASYRSAVAAAKGYCIDMAAAVDLHHRDFWRALEIQPPVTLVDERQLAADVFKILRDRPVPPSALKAVRWGMRPAATRKSRATS